eukprot:4078957-Prorocentrum_lima.AAC.1
MLPQSPKPGTERNMLGVSDNCVPGLSENIDGNSSGGGLSLGGRMLDEGLSAAHLPETTHKCSDGHARKPVPEDAAPRNREPAQAGMLSS